MSFDFKSATPANFASGGFLFGADSQVAADPSIYSDTGLLSFFSSGITTMPNLTTVGTIGTGTWQGTAVDISYGGTGQTSKAAAFDALSPMSASGDIIYGGASGTGTRLAKGTDGQVLTLAAGVPSWAAASGGTWSALSGSVANGGFTLTVPTLSANATLAVLGLAQTFIAAQTIKIDAIGTSSTNGFLLRNTTAAAAGAQQYSPRSVWEGQGWKTTATAASQAVAFMAEVRPVQGAANPTGTWALAASINGGAYSDVLTVTSAGGLTAIGDVTTGGKVFANSVQTLGLGTVTFRNSGGTALGQFDASGSVLFGLGGANTLASDGANIAALRNAGTAGSPVPQALNVYNFCATVATDAEWGYAKWVSNVFRIGTAAAVGTGSVRNIRFDIGGANKLDYGDTTAATWTFASKIAVPGLANPVLTTTSAITSGAGSSAGTLTNAPVVGDPTKWIPINDNGTTRYIPAW